MNNTRSAHARRLYHHHVNGGKLTDDDVSKLVQYLEELETELDTAETHVDAFCKGAMYGASCAAVYNDLFGDD